MKLINHTYRDDTTLLSFIQKEIPADKAVLIQLFCADLDTSRIQRLLDTLTAALPDAAIIGATSAGNIVDGHIAEGRIDLAFTIFETSRVRTLYIPRPDYDAGVRCAEAFVTDQTKALIMFAESIHQDNEPFLQGFSARRGDIPLAGGNAGDNYRFEQTFIIHQNRLYDKGAVLCALEGETLKAYTDYSLEWKSIGSEMTITRAEGNTVYEIDHTPVEEVYRFYLGPETLENFPASVIEFPLVKIEDGVQVARSVVGRNDKGGFVYAGHFEEGDKVRFAIGSIDDVLAHSHKLFDRIVQHPVEAIFVYSCCVRKQFIGEQLNYEFAMLQQIAPTAGFFTYGEFFHGQTSCRMLNITTTTLSLAETDTLPEKPKLLPAKYATTKLNALINLVNASERLLHQYKELLDTSAIVSMTDPKGRIVYANDTFCEISGYSRKELIGRTHNIVRHPDMDKGVFREMWRTITAKKVWKGTIKNRAKDGRTYYVKSVIMPILGEDGEIVNFIAARVDVTELIQKERIIQRQRVDRLTGLENRQALLDDLHIEADRDATLMLINIDRFSEINEYYGFEKGDEVLKTIAEALKKRYDKAYRISGDEFAILCEHDFDAQTRRALMATLAELENGYYGFGTEGNILFLSGGVAYGKKALLYKQANIALKAAKSSNDKIVFFNERQGLEESIETNIKTIAKINRAIEEDRIVPVFQPIVDNRTRRTVKYESLIRLKEPDGTLLSPYFFLETAKRAKLYTKLTKIMIAKTFKTFAHLDYEFSINLSIQDILSFRVVHALFEHLERYRCGHRVVLEIVESEGIDNDEEVERFIRQVKGYGCKIAVDDFGTGYSNFSYLTRLDIDYIKIDGSLIKDIDSDPTHFATVETIVYFAKKMGLRTIAEFVEDEAVYQKLCELGVDFSQGYYFGKPTEEVALQ